MNFLGIFIQLLMSVYFILLIYFLLKKEEERKMLTHSLIYKRLLNVKEVLDELVGSYPLDDKEDEENEKINDNRG